MAQGFNIVARLQLQGPTNVSQVVQQLQKQLSNVNVKVNAQLSPQAQKAAAATSKSLNNLNQSATKANTSITQLSTSSSKAGSSASSAAKNFNQATTAATAFGKASALAVKRFAAFTVGAGIIGGVVVALKNGVKEAVDFEREMIKVSQVTGQSIGSLGSLQKEITGLSTSLGVASSELVTVARTLSQTGISAREVKAALKSLAQSALAPTFKDMSNTVEGAISIMRQFGVQADDIGKKLGSINALAGSFAVEAQDLVFAVRRAGGAFKAAGGNLEELLALFTSVRATTRESAETIATGFRTIFTRIQRPKTIAFLKEAGVELQNMAGQFVGPYEAVNRLSKALRELESTDPRFQQIIEELGGFRQVSKVIPLIQQFGTAQKALGVALRGQDSLARDSVKAQQGLAVQLTKVREQFLGLMRDVAGGDTFKTMATTAVGLASSFLKVADALKPVLPLMAGLAAFQGLRFGAQFTTGFFGGLRGAGGASAAGRGVAGTVTGASASTAATKQSQALASNTTALLKLNASISNLQTAINRNIAATNKSAVRGAGSLGGRRGRRPRGFNTGGLVPGQGHGDIVPAMLEPGEFVIRKSSVEKYGATNLARMNSGGKLGDVSRKRRLGGGARGAFYASSRTNRFSKKMHGDKKKRAYVFDFDDTLAVSDAVVREGEADPFMDFRGAKGGQFIRSARATKYANMARRRASRGHDIHVVTARPGDKTTRSAIHHFMRSIGAAAKSVVGTGGFSEAMGGTPAAKQSVVRNKIAPHYERTIFLDDDRENVMAVGALKNVKSIQVGKSGLSRARLKKQFGGNVQRYMVGTTRPRGVTGSGLVRETGKLMGTKPASSTIRRVHDKKTGRASVVEQLTDQALDKALNDAHSRADPNWYAGAFLRPGAKNTIYKGVNDPKEIAAQIKKTPGFSKFETIKKQALKPEKDPKTGKMKKFARHTKGSMGALIRDVDNEANRIISDYQKRNQYHLEAGSLGAQTSNKMEGELLLGIHNTVKKGAKVISKTLKTNFTNEDVAGAMKTANVDQTLGNLFEQVLMYAGVPFSPKDRDAANAPWDFPKGLGGVSSHFSIKKSGVQTDAKTSFTNYNIKSLMAKVDSSNAKEAQAELDGVFYKLANSPEFKQAVRQRQMGKVDKDDFEAAYGGSRRRDITRRWRTRRKAGGNIPSSSDTVPALLTPGEYVINKKSAQRIGYGTLNSINKGTKPIQGYAKGGLVQHFRTGGKSSESGGMGGGGLLTLLFAVDMLAASFTQGNKELEKWVGILSATGTALIGVKAVLDSVASAQGLASLGGALQQSGISQIKGGPSNARTRINVSGMNKAFGRAKLGVGKFTTALGGMMGPLSTVAAGLTAAYVAAGILADQFKTAGLEMLEHARTSTQEEAALDKWITGERIDNAKKIGGIFALVAGGIATVVGGILAATGVLSPIGAGLMAAGVATASAGAGAAFGYGQNVNTQPFQQARNARDAQRQRDITGNLLKRVNSSGLGLSGATGQQALSSIRKEFNLMLTQTDPDKRSEQNVELQRRVPELQNMVTMILESGQDFATAAGGLGPALLELIADITGTPLEQLQKETNERAELIKKVNEAKAAKAAEAAETRNVTRELGIFNAALQSVNDGLSDLETTLTGITQMGLFGDVYAPFGSAAGRGGIIGRAAEGSQVNLGDFNTAVGQVTQDPFLQQRANDIAALQNILPDVISKAAAAAQAPGGPTFGTALRDILADTMGLDDISGSPLLESVVQSLTAIVTKTTTEQGGPNATLGRMQDDPMSFVQDALNEGDTAFLNALQESFNQMVQAQEKINGLMQQRMQLERELLQRQQKIRKAEKQLEDFNRSQERGGLGRPMTLREINERQEADTNSILGGTRGAGMGGDVVGLTGALMQINRDREALLERQRLNPDLDVSKELGNLNNEAMRVTAALEGLGDQAEKLAALQKLLAREQKKRQFKEDQLLKLAFGDEDDAQSFVNSIQGSSLVQQGLNPQMLPPQVRQDAFNFLTSLGDTPMEFLGGQTGTEVLRTGLISYLQDLFPDRSREQIEDMVDPIINATMEEKRIQRAIKQTLIDQIFVQRTLATITQDAIRRNTDVLEAAIERAEKGITAAIYRAEADRADRKAREAQGEVDRLDNQIEARQDLNNNNVGVDVNEDGDLDDAEDIKLDRPLTFEETKALPGASGRITGLGQPDKRTGATGDESVGVIRDENNDGIPDSQQGQTLGSISGRQVTRDADGNIVVAPRTPSSITRPQLGTAAKPRGRGRRTAVDAVDPTYDPNQMFDDGTGTGTNIQFGEYLQDQLKGLEVGSDEYTEKLREAVKKFYGKGGLAGTELSGLQQNDLVGKITGQHQRMDDDGRLGRPGGYGVGGETVVQDFMGTVLEEHAAAAKDFNQAVDNLSAETGIAADVIRQFANNIELLNAFLQKINVAGTTPIEGPGGLSEQRDDASVSAADASATATTAGGRADTAESEQEAADTKVDKARTTDSDFVLLKRFKNLVDREIRMALADDPRQDVNVVRGKAVDTHWSPEIEDAALFKHFHTKDDLKEKDLTAWPFRKGGLADFNAGRIRTGLAAGAMSQGRDNILGLVHKGEYLVPADKAAANLPILDEITNGNGLSKMPIPKFSNGGLVGMLPTIAKQIAAAGGGIGFGETTSSLGLGKFSEEITGGKKLKQLYDELQKINTGIQQLPNNIVPATDLPEMPDFDNITPTNPMDPGAGPVPVEIVGSRVKTGPSYAAVGGPIGGAPSSSSPSGPGPVTSGTGSAAGSMARSSDTRLAVLTPGEFVINKDATSKHRGLLEAINSGVYARTGGEIPYLRGGGGLRGANPPRRPGPNSTPEEKQQYRKDLAEWFSANRSTSGRPGAGFGPMAPYAGGAFEGLGRRSDGSFEMGSAGVPQGLGGPSSRKRKKAPKTLVDRANGAPGIDRKGKIIDREAYDKWKDWDASQAALIKNYQGSPQGGTGLYNRNNPTVDSPGSIESAVVGSSDDYNKLGPRAQRALKNYRKAQRQKNKNKDYNLAYKERQKQRRDREKDWNTFVDDAGNQAYANKGEYRKERDKDLYSHIMLSATPGDSRLTYAGDTWNKYDPDRFADGGAVLTDQEKKVQDKYGVKQYTQKEYEKIKEDELVAKGLAEHEARGAVGNFRTEYREGGKLHDRWKKDQELLAKKERLGIGYRQKSMDEIYDEVLKEGFTGDEAANIMANRFEQQYQQAPIDVHSAEDRKALGIKARKKGGHNYRNIAVPDIGKADELMAPSRQGIPFDKKGRDDMMHRINTARMSSPELLTPLGSDVPKDYNTITEKELQEIEDAEYRTYLSQTAYPEKAKVIPLAARYNPSGDLIVLGSGGRGPNKDSPGVSPDELGHQRASGNITEGNQREHILKYGIDQKFKEKEWPSREDFNKRVLAQAVEEESARIDANAGLIGKDKPLENPPFPLSLVPAYPRNDLDALQGRITAGGSADAAGIAGATAMGTSVVPGGQPAAVIAGVTAAGFDAHSAATSGMIASYEAEKAKEIRDKLGSPAQKGATVSGPKVGIQQSLLGRMLGFDSKFKTDIPAVPGTEPNLTKEQRQDLELEALARDKRSSDAGKDALEMGAWATLPVSGIAAMKQLRGFKGIKTTTHTKIPLRNRDFTNEVIGAGSVGTGSAALYDPYKRKGGAIGYYSVGRYIDDIIEQADHRMGDVQRQYDINAFRTSGLEQAAGVGKLADARAARGAELLEARTKHANVEGSDLRVEKHDEFDFTGLNADDIAAVREVHLRRIEMAHKAEANGPAHRAAYEAMEEWKRQLIRHDPNLAIEFGEKPFYVGQVLSNDVQPGDFGNMRHTTLSGEEIEEQLRKDAAREVTGSQKGLAGPAELKNSPPLIADVKPKGGALGTASEGSGADVSAVKRGRSPLNRGLVKTELPPAIRRNRELRKRVTRPTSLRAVLNKVRGKKTPPPLPGAKTPPLTGKDFKEIAEYQETLRHEIEHIRTRASEPDFDKQVPHDMALHDAAITLDRARQGDMDVTAKEIAAAQKIFADKAAYARKARQPGYTPTPAPDTMGSRIRELELGALDREYRREMMRGFDMEEGSPVDVQLREEQAALDSQSDILNELRSNMAEPSRRGRVKGSKQRREKQRPDIINTGAPPPLPGASPRVTSPEDMAGVREKAGAGFLFDDRVQRYYAATYQSNMSNVRLSPEQKKTLRQIPIDKWSELDIWEQIGPEGQAYVRNYKKNVAQMRTDYLESRGTPDAMRKEGIEFVRATDPETGMPKIYRGSKQKPFTQEFLERIKDDPNLKHYRKGGYFSLGGWVAKMLGFGEEALPKAGSKSHIKHKRNDLGFSINTTKSRAEQKQIIAIKRNSRGNRDMKEIATRESGVKNFAKGKQPWDINPDTKEYYADEMLPKTEEGMKRLYRTVDEEAFLSGAMGSGRQHSNTDSVLLEGAQEAAGKWFSDDINSMAFYSNQLLKEGKTPRLTYVDIPIEEAGKYNVKAQLPRELPEGFPVNPRLEGGHEAVSKIMKEEGLTHDEAMRTAIHRYQDAQENLANNPKWFSGGASSPEGLTGEYFLQNTEHVMGPGGRMMTRYTDPSKYLDDVKAFKRGGLVSYLRFGGDGTRTMFDMINTYISSRTARTVDHKLVEKSRRDVNRAINRQRHIDGSRSTEGTALPGQRTGAEQHAANVQAAVVDAAKSGDQDAVRFFESESERAKKILNKRTYERDMYEGSGRHARKEVSARAAVGEASASKAAMSDIVRSKATVPKEPSFVMGPDGKIHQLPIVKKPDLITNVTDVRTGEGIKVRQGPDPMKVMSGAPETPRGTGVDDFELQPRPEELDPDSSQIVPGLSGSNVLPQGGGPLPAGSGPQGALPSDSSTPPFTSASAATELHIPNLSRLSDPVDVPNAKLDFTIDDQLKNANRPNRRVEEGSVYTLDSAAKADAAMTEAQKRLGTQFFKGKTNAQLQEELGILRANINSAEMQRAVESGEEALRQLGIEPLPYRGNRAQMDYKAIEAMNAGRKTPPPAFIAGGAGPEVSDRLAEGKAPPSGQDIMNMNLDLKSGDLTPEQLKKIQEDNKRKMNRKRLGGMISYLQFGGGLKDKRVMPLPSVTPTQKNIRIASPNLNDNPAKHIQDMMEVIYGRSRSGTDDKTGRAKAFPGGRRKRELAKEAWMSDRKGNLEKYDMDFNIAEELFPSFYAKQPWLDTKQAEQDYLDFFDKFESEEARKFFLDSNNFPEMFTGGHLRYDKSFHRGGRYEPRKDRISLPAAEIEEMGLFERSPYNPNQLNVSRLGQGILHEGQQHRAIYEMLFREGRKAAGIPSLDSEYPRVSHTPGITNALQFGKGELTTGLTFPEPERQGFLKMLKERSPDIYKAYAGYRRNTGVKEKWKEDRGKPGTGERKDFWEIFGKDKGTNFQKYATGGDELLARLRTIADWNAMNDRNVLEALGKLEKGASNEEILDVYRNTPRMNSSLGLDKDGNPSIRQSWKNIQKYRNALHKNYDRDNRQITDMGMHRSTLEAMLSGKDEKKHLAELLILARKSGGPITRLEQGGGTGMGSAGASISTGGPVSHGTGVPAGELARSTDTRLTALTPGEFVVNKAMTDRHRGLLEQINSGQYARDGGIIYRRMGTPAFSGISQPTPQLNNWQNIFSALKPEINQGPQGQPIDFTKLTDGANTIKDAFDSFTDTLVGLDFAGQIKEAMSGNDIFKAFSDAIKGESALTKSLNDFTEKFGSGQTIKHEMTIPGIKNGMKLDPQEMEKFKADVITAVVSVLEGNQPESPVNKPAGDVT